jgi:hypothetical protein
MEETMANVAAHTAAVDMEAMKEVMASMEEIIKAATESLERTVSPIGGHHTGSPINNGYVLATVLPRYLVWMLYSKILSFCPSILELPISLHNCMSIAIPNDTTINHHE